LDNFKLFYHKIKSNLKQKEQVAQQFVYVDQVNWGYLLQPGNGPLPSWSLVKPEAKIKPHTFFLPTTPPVNWSSVVSEELFTVSLSVLSFSTII